MEHDDTTTGGDTVELAEHKYKPKEIAALLVKDAGLHEGKWMLSVHFGFAAMNIGPESGHLPAGVVLVTELGIKEVDDSRDHPTSLTVDAEKVNPRKSK